jgi:hypothetical protein
MARDPEHDDSATDDEFAALRRARFGVLPAPVATTDLTEMMDTAPAPFEPAERLFRSEE